VGSVLRENVSLFEVLTLNLRLNLVSHLSMAYRTGLLELLLDSVRGWLELRRHARHGCRPSRLVKRTL